MKKLLSILMIIVCSISSSCSTPMHPERQVESKRQVKEVTYEKTVPTSPSSP